MTSTTISEALQRATTTTTTTRALGSTNENPRGLSLWTLLHEDFRTYGSTFIEPGFWAVVVHRFGNARMSIRVRALRAPLSLAYHVLYRVVMWLWGIDLGYTVKIGRRVRIWHHGGIVIGAKRIGDDVHIRQNTTLGVLHRGHDDEKPTIGDRVDIGAGACILGNVTVGDDVVVGANSVVVKDVPAGAVMFGVPARPVKLL